MSAHASMTACGCRLRTHKRCGSQERLLTGLAAAQSVECEAASFQVHLAAHQTTGLERSDGERVAQHLHGTMRSRASQIDHMPTQGGVELSPPSLL